jgi:hypothetical protein
MVMPRWFVAFGPAAVLAAVLVASFVLFERFRVSNALIVGVAVATVLKFLMDFTLDRLATSREIDVELREARAALRTPAEVLAATTVEQRESQSSSVGDKPSDVVPFMEEKAVADQALVRSESAASRVQPAWDLARATLAKYWNRNLAQNSVIFVSSIIVSTLGFGVTLWGVYAAINNQAPLSASILAAASGAVTQIIGTTFLVIYRSTAQQALEFNRTLERINSVGMAWYVLQAMSEETDAHKKAKDAAKAALVLSVITASGNAAVVAVGSGQERQLDDKADREKVA